MNTCKFLNQKFCHLHLHTEYSPQDAPVSLKKMVEYTKHLGYKSVAVTDHGTISSWVKFQALCKKNDVKPIFGIEAYFTPDRHVKKTRKDNYHQLLLAKNNQGIKNLYKISELAYSEGYYYDPRIDWDLLEQYHEGIICTSACVSGIVAETYVEKGKSEATKVADRFRSIFGDDYYLEVQYHNLEIEECYVGVAEVASDLGIKIVGTNDVHYLRQEDHNCQEALMALNMRRCIKDPERMQHDQNQFYLKNPDEMLHILGGKDAQAVVSTLEIMDKCTAEIEMGKTSIPSIDIPKGKTDFEHLSDLAWSGLKDRRLNAKPEYRERLEYELGIVKKLRDEKGLMFDRYFLVVEDYVRYARDNDILVGVGRGSGAGSLILYCLKITGIDPIKYGLMFERFLAEDRVAMPDIDIDFDSEVGDKMFEYLTEKYGSDRWARIGTFNTFGVAGALRAAYRVYDPGNTWENNGKEKSKPARRGNDNGLRDETVRMANEATKLLPRLKDNPDPKCTLRQDLKDEDEERIYVYDVVPEFRNLRVKHPEMYAFAEHIEGLVQSRGRHAAGVVITEGPTVELAPQQFVGKKEMATVYAMEDIEAVGGLKFDILQTKVLSVFARTLKMIKNRYNKNVPIDDLDPEDQKVLDLFCQGQTAGIFQFESSGITSLLTKMQPSCFEDIMAANALYRPGPMQYIDEFCDRKHGRRRISYDVDILESILKPTYGIMVYQEQVMKICQVLAGFTGSEADKVRKGMGKKKKDILEEMKSKFVKGCAAGATCSPAVAEKIWADMEHFASYAFNKAHSCGYGYTAYQCAYLKKYYPEEFMAAQMTVEGNSTSGHEACVKYERIVQKSLGIPLLPLDVNTSKGDYEVEYALNGTKSIRRGFKGVKGIGKAYEFIEAGQPYKDVYDFCARAGEATKSNVAQALIQEGAFDCMLDALSQFVPGGRATRADLEKEYNKMIKRARSANNVKGVKKEEKEGIQAIFTIDNASSESNVILSLEDF